jgi:hypothetical protein
MKKIDIGQSVSIMANIGVIIGLVFLALEVRHSRTATELQTLADVQSGWFALNDAVVRDTEVSRIFVTGLYKPDELSTVEAAQFSMYLRMFANQVGRIWRHYELGLMPEEQYLQAVAEMTALMKTPGGQLFRKAEPRFDEGWLEDIKPFFGKDPPMNLLLGRDPSTIE